MTTTGWNVAGSGPTVPSGWGRARHSPAWWIGLTVAFAAMALDAYGWSRVGGLYASTNGYMWDLGGILELAVGMTFWMLRPRNLVGPLMVAVVAISDVSDLAAFFPGSRLAVTVGYLFVRCFLTLYILLLFMFPSGRLWKPRLTVPLVILVGIFFLAENVPLLLFGDPSVHSYFYVGHGWSGLAGYTTGWTWARIGEVVVVVSMMMIRLMDATPSVRRRIAPLFLSITALWMFNVIELVVHNADPSTFPHWLAYVWNSQFWISAAGAAFALTSLSLSRGAVADLIVALGRGKPGEIQGTLASALGDPSMDLGLWVPERAEWVDERDNPVSLPTDGSRAVTYVGERLGVLVHDHELLAQPRLLQGVAAAGAWAVENARLQAQLRFQVAALRNSRSRVVRAGDEERRRLERDLHDGAQQRLLSVGIWLQRVRTALSEEGEEVIALLDATGLELSGALSDLRELAHGIYPPALADHGLEPAIRSLAMRAPVPVDVTATSERFPAEIEAAAYYVLAEGLTNIAKHAHAQRVSLVVARSNGDLRITISDDGVGGATSSGASGLRGLADRVGALGGELTVTSPAGSGTRLVATIPLRTAGASAHVTRELPDAPDATLWRHRHSDSVPLTVLIVDDDDGYRRSVHGLLEDAGFSVVGEAGSCADALVAAVELQPNVILLDVMLPDGSGLDCAATLAGLCDAATRIVLTSGRDPRELGLALEATPSSGFIAKGDFTVQEFSSLVGTP